MIGRSILIALSVLLLALLAWVRPAACGHKVIGVVFTGELPRYREAHRAFLKGMSARGFDQGAVEYVVQVPNPDPGSWANASRKLKAIGVNMVVAYGAPAALAVVQEAESIPMVFVDVFGPQESTIVRLMSGDNGTITGVTSKVPLVTIIKAAQELRPIKTLGVLYNPQEVGSRVQLAELKRLAAKNGFSVREAKASTGAGLDQSLSALLKKADCLFVAESVIAGRHMERIVTRASEAGVPVLSSIPGASDKGALVTLEVSPAEQGQLAAEHAARILAGAHPGRLQVQTPRQIDLIVNLKTAKTLDIQVPFQVLSMATRIVK